QIASKIPFFVRHRFRSGWWTNNKYNQWLRLNYSIKFAAQRFAVIAGMLPHTVESATVTLVRSPASRRFSDGGKVRNPSLMGALSRERPETQWRRVDGVPGSSQQRAAWGTTCA